MLFIDPSRISMDILDSVLEYFRVFFLAELISYSALYKQIHKHQHDLKRIFELVGQLDASLSIHHFILDNEQISTPEISEGFEQIEFNDLIHPLVENCVSNSGIFTRGVVLTGANMAGKSTFLRTLGINTVLATTMNIAFCSSFKIPFLRVASSLQPAADSLELKQSHYYAEALRLFALWSKGRNDRFRWLLLLDEVLSGTNSKDRNNSVNKILEDLAGCNSLVIATTHEEDTAEYLSDNYDNYHFTETIIDNVVEFDYKLREGIVDCRNALRLLLHVGFPKDLIGSE